MARAKLLRQYVEDYQRKVAGVNEQVEAANTAYQNAYGQYASGVNAYNAQVEKFNADASAPGVYYTQDGKLMQNGQEAVFNTSASSPYEIITDDNGKQYVAYWDNGSLNGDHMPVRNMAPYVGEAPVNPNLTAPAAPVAPEPVREPGFTRSNIREMSNPGLSQAQLAMGRAQGFEGKSELKGDEMTAATSAFASEDDPNNLKEKGILARVMGGQL